MTLITFDSLDDLKQAVGTQLGPTDWITITQDQVNAFADATLDNQWIHVDTERAKAGPFGTPIAHGFRSCPAFGLQESWTRPGREVKTVLRAEVHAQIFLKSSLQILGHMLHAGDGRIGRHSCVFRSTGVQRMV